MTLKLQHHGYNWAIRAGFPPMGSVERTDPLFVDALKTAHPPLTKMTVHEIGSWIVGRLSYLTAGSLAVEGDVFAHDTNDFGYKIKITDNSKASVAHGAIVIHADGIRFASVDVKINDFQTLLVELLTESADDLAACEIRVQEPETRKYRTYGWDGYSLLR